MVVVAEEHRDEFRAVAEYLNGVAELDRDNGIQVWLVEAKAVRIDGGPWAPLFTAVVQPNDFTARVEQAKQTRVQVPPEVFWAQFGMESIRSRVHSVIASWNDAGYQHKLLGNRVVLQSPGPAKSRMRVVVSLAG